MLEKILILDFGSQYTQLIARRIREINVYCEIFPFNNFPVPDATVKGVILSGSPFSVRNENPPDPDLSGFKGRVPVLGICYGAQLMVHKSGGEVTPSKTREYGRANLVHIDPAAPLFAGGRQGTQVWMSHGDTIEKLPSGFEVCGSTADVMAASYKIRDEETWGIQFHPEVYHTVDGLLILKNFVFTICGCKGDWTPDSFIDESIKEIRRKIGGDKVILGLSGGIDSALTAAIAATARKGSGPTEPVFR